MQIQAIQAPKTPALLTSCKYLVNVRLSGLVRSAFPTPEENKFTSLNGRELTYLYPVKRSCREFFDFVKVWFNISKHPKSIANKEKTLSRVRLREIHAKRRPINSLDLSIPSLWEKGPGLKAEQIVAKNWKSLRSKNVVPSIESVVKPGTSIEKVIPKSPKYLEIVITRQMHAEGLDPSLWGVKSKKSIEGSTDDKNQNSRRLSKLIEELLKEDRTLYRIKEPGGKTKLLLVANVTIVDAVELDKNGHFKSRLGERERKINNGVSSRRIRGPFLDAIGEKLGEHESPAVGAIRGVNEEFQKALKHGLRKVRLESLAHINSMTSFGPSDDYHGLLAFNHYHVFEAVIDPEQFEARTIVEETGKGENKQKITFGFNEGMVLQRETTTKLILVGLLNLLGIYRPVVAMKLTRPSSRQMKVASVAQEQSNDLRAAA